MRFPKLKTAIMSSVLASLFVAGIFVSCHSLEMANVSNTDYSHAQAITQSVAEPCCMAESSNYSLRSLTLAALAPTAPLHNDVLGSPMWFQDTMKEGLPDGRASSLGSTPEVPLYNYLVTFIAQGLLQPQIYNVSKTSA